jgi:hypothetical protein
MLSIIDKREGSRRTRVPLLLNSCWPGAGMQVQLPLSRLSAFSRVSVWASVDILRESPIHVFTTCLEVTQWEGREEHECRFFATVADHEQACRFSCLWVGSLRSCESRSGQVSNLSWLCHTSLEVPKLEGREEHEYCFFSTVDDQEQASKFSCPWVGSLRSHESRSGQVSTSWRNCFDQIYLYYSFRFWLFSRLSFSHYQEGSMTSWRNCFDQIYSYRFISFMAVLATHSVNSGRARWHLGGTALTKFIHLYLFRSWLFSRLSPSHLRGGLNGILEELLWPNLFISIHFVPDCSRDFYSVTSGEARWHLRGTALTKFI